MYPLVEHHPSSEIKLTDPRFVKIGLAGGIGSGKTFVSNLFGSRGAYVSSADEISRSVLNRPEVIAQLTDWWGEKVVCGGEGADRKAIASIVFQDPQERKRLESLVHPIVEQIRLEQMAEAKRIGTDLFVIDAPLLFEAGLDKQCDVVVFVDAPQEVRLERVMKSRGWSSDELGRRESAQFPLSQKRESSDFVVINDGDISQVERQVNDIIAIIRSQMMGTSERNSPIEPRLDP